MNEQTHSNPANTTGAPQQDVHTSTRSTPQLLRWLYRKAEQRGHSRIALASELGVTYGYLNQLVSGIRQVNNVSQKFVRDCARYLEIPAVAVMLVTDRVSLLDFALPEPSRAPVHQLVEGLHRIADDPVVGCLVPAEVWDVPDSVKALLIALYEDATQQELFPPKRLPMLLQGLQDAALLVAETDAQDYADLMVDAARGVH